MSVKFQLELYLAALAESGKEVISEQSAFIGQDARVTQLPAA